jgi:hypothetical protein
MLAVPATVPLLRDLLVKLISESDEVYVRSHTVTVSVDVTYLEGAVYL